MVSRFRPTTAVCSLLLALAGCSSQSPEPPPRAASAEISPVTSESTTRRAPDLVGMRLIEAREALRNAGYATGAEAMEKGDNRPVLEPANWIVSGQDPSAGMPVEPGTRFSLTVVRPTDRTTAPATAKGVVPQVVCLDLQKAQGALRAVGFFYVTSSDATGQGRQQLVDRNWVVVAQSVPPDSSPGSATHIDLSVVKFGEPTGASGCAS